MKKFLSLVLALVMTMSLVTISAGAKDYTDASEINYAEAVQVMSELKVIDGYADGSFNPDATLTRGAAAKIICNLILGPTTAAALKADSAVFPDVPADHTFAGYIAYCAQQGIINGYSDGTFKPANGLTGYAFMKMLLGALGYDAVAEGYVGANYSIQVAKQALAIGLDDGNDAFDGTKIVTREEALLYAFNAMTADMVSYNQKTEVNTGTATVTISGGRMDVANTKFDYADREDDETMQFCEKYFEKLTLDADEYNEFGQPVNTWKNGKKEIGSFVKAADAHYEKNVASKDIYSDVDLDDIYEFETIIDGVEEGEFAIVKKDKTKLNTMGLVGNGSDVYVYVDDARIVVINTYIYEVADDYNDKKETLTIDQVDDVKYPEAAEATYTLSSEDWAGLDEYADGDYVLVTIADDEIMSIAKVEAVKATVTEYVHAESVTAGGEEYKYSAASEQNDDDGDDFSYELKKEASFYLDEEGYVLFSKAEAATKKYLYIAEFSKHSTSSRAAAEAIAFFLDATEAEIKVGKIGDTSVKGTDVEGNEIEIDGTTYGAGWYTYSEKDGKYNLKKADDTKHEAGEAGVVVDYSETHTLIADLKGNKFDGTKKTNFLLVDEDGELVAYTGIKNIPDITGTEKTIVNVVTGSDYAEYVYIDLSEGGEITNDNTAVKDYIFLLKAEARGNDTDDDGYYRYKALVNGEEKTIRYDEAIEGAGDAALTLWTDIEYTSKTYIEDAKEVTGATSSKREKHTKDVIAEDAVELSSTTLEFKTAGEYTDYFMADDYTIFVIETDGTYDTYTMKQLTRAEDLAGDTIYGLLNADGEYYALYIVRD